MKPYINLKIKSIALMLSLLGIFGYHTVAHSGLSIVKGEASGEVRITVINPTDNACGAQINLGDGKTQSRRLEPKEQWQLQHAFNADGNFTVKLSGVFIPRGLRSVGPCELQQQVSVNVAGGQATASTAPVPAATPSAAAPVSQAAAQAQVAPPPPPSPGESADLLLFFRKDSNNLRFVTTIDGTKKLESVDRLINNGYQLCYILQPDSYRGLGGADAQRSLNNEVSRTINAFAGNRQVRNTQVDCIRNGQFVGASFADVVAVQRRVVPDLKAVREFAGFEQFGEVKYDTLAQAVSRRQQAIEKRTQDVATWTAEINTLSVANSFDKIGSITLSAPQSERESIKVCRLEYAGMQSQAIISYGKNLIGYTSPAFRIKATDSRATFNANQPYSSTYRSMDDFYVEHQKEPSKCNVFVDFPKNLKILMIALERDRKGVAFEINTLMPTDEMREEWAKSQGYESLAASEFAAQIRGNATSLKNLAEKGIRDKPSFDRVAEEMRSARYSDSTAVGDVLNFLNDKAAAAEKRGATAVSIRDERAATLRVEAERRAQEEQRRRAEYAKEFPYTATISCGMNDRHINIMACMSGKSSVKSQLELTNGKQYKMYQQWEISQAGNQTAEGLVIPLRSNFTIKMQNVEDTLLLTVKVVSNATGRVVFTKSAAKYGVIILDN
jgi:hypothetical protein